MLAGVVRPIAQVPSRALYCKVISALRLPRPYYLLISALGGFCLALYLAPRSNWYKERLYRQLLCGNERQQLVAASALARLGGEKQLLDGLKSQTGNVRDLARRALEYRWFHAAGEEAHRILEQAFEAADKEDFSSALALLDRLVRQFPQYAEGWNRRASVHWQMGNYEKSVADCQKALALNPNHYGAWQGIGVCWVKLGNVSEACRCLRAALKIIPYDEATRHCLEKCEELLRVMPAPEPQVRGTEII